jgi:hypothetical protein
MARSLPRRFARFGSAASQQKSPKKEAAAHFPVAQNIALECGRAVYNWRRNLKLMGGDAHKGGILSPLACYRRCTNRAVIERCS